MAFVIHAGNNLDVLPTLPDNSVDSIVTDPPYELGFMGKKWDNSGIAYSVELWTECLRVLKPGGHLLSFGGTRTWHRVAVAIEDAGFDVRDSIAWMYGSGFPKSLDVSKAINKSAGVEYESKPASGVGFMNATDDGYNTTLNQLSQVGENTPEAEQWQGWGTALKPAFEPIVVARKPLAGKTVAANVLEHGTGALNIDGSRIGTETGDYNHPGNSGIQDKRSVYGKFANGNQVEPHAKGRWPANVILDEHSAGELDEQSGNSKSPDKPVTQGGKEFGMGGEAGRMRDGFGIGYGDTGGASRFFYCAKASKRDRNEGLEGLEAKAATRWPQGGIQEGSSRGAISQNFHPTVKPTNLMRYLVKLVTPPGGTVLDPFTGSGSTGKAAILEGFDFIGIELTEEYLPIIDARLKHAEQAKLEEQQTKDEGLF
jgi:DNA modification methylase